MADSSTPEGLAGLTKERQPAAREDLTDWRSITAPRGSAFNFVRAPPEGKAKEVTMADLTAKKPLPADQTFFLVRDIFRPLTHLVTSSGGQYPTWMQPEYGEWADDVAWLARDGALRLFEWEDTHTDPTNEAVFVFLRRKVALLVATYFTAASLSDEPAKHFSPSHIPENEIREAMEWLLRTAWGELARPAPEIEWDEIAKGEVNHV